MTWVPVVIRRADTGGVLLRFTLPLPNRLVRKFF